MIQLYQLLSCPSLLLAEELQISHLVKYPCAPNVVEKAKFPSTATGPVSNSLLSRAGFAHAAGAYGFQNYGPLLLYTGVTMVAGSAVGISFRDPKKRVVAS